MIAVWPLPRPVDVTIRGGPLGIVMTGGTGVVRTGRGPGRRKRKGTGTRAEEMVTGNGSEDEGPDHGTVTEGGTGLGPRTGRGIGIPGRGDEKATID